MYQRSNRPKTVAISPRPSGIHLESSDGYRPKTGSYISHHEPRPPPIREWSDVSGFGRSSGTSRPVTGSSSTLSQGIYVNYVPYSPVVPHGQEQHSYQLNFQDYIAYKLYRYILSKD